MFRRIIAIWLIISILGYGVALAAGVHDEALPADSSAQTLSVGDSQPDPMDQQADSDHCCHGIAHLLGFANQIVAATMMASSPPIAFHAERPPTFIQLPAFRPPKKA